jgi:asparagine synthase (glutamine-hydrolysing)
MPSAIAGVAGWLEPESRFVGVALLSAMAVPGLGISARTSDLLVQGDARIEQVSGHEWHQHDGRPDEEVIVEFDPSRVVLRRDALGVRPLYYACSPDRQRLAWASRPSQLWTVPWVDRRPHWDKLLDVVGLTAQADPTRTCLEGIRQVQPGHSLEWRPGQIVEFQHWDPSDFLWDGGRAHGDAFATFASLLGDALERRIAEPSALMLSGGIDSPVLAAAAMRRHLPVVGLSNVYPVFPAADESVNIRAVLRAVGMSGELLPVKTATPLDIDAELSLYGEPHAGTNHAGYLHILRAAAERGHKVVVDGCDGDSALGSFEGLGRYLPTRPALAVKAWRFHRARGAVPRGIIGAWLQDLSPATFDRLRAGKAMLRPAPPASESRPLLASWGRDLLDRRQESPRLSWREAQLRATGPMISDVLVLMGRAADSWGVDLVHPFADRTLMEFLLSLPPEIKHAGGRWKGLARVAFPELPAAVRDAVNKVDITDAVEAQHPLSEMRQFLQDPAVPVPFVDYERLRARLSSGQPYEHGELHHLRALALVQRFLETRYQPVEHPCRD